MIIKKVSINGNDIYVQITNDEAIKSAKNNEELIFDSEEEKTKFYKTLESKTEEPKKKTNASRIYQMLPFLDEEELT